ncbi:MAG: DUF4372 domain-containing protein, partial [Planctomycetota bacterium]
MNTGRLIFSPLMDDLPTHGFNGRAERYRGNYRTRWFRCRDQFLSMAFAPLTYRESLRDIETSLRSRGRQRYHAGIRAHVARRTLADANENRDWPIYADVAAVLITRARRLYADETFRVDLDQIVYTFDSTTIDLCEPKTSRRYPAVLRRIRDYAEAIDTWFVFLTNNFTLDALVLAELYRSRWQVELFFRPPRPGRRNKKTPPPERQ